ncbi:MAG: substrate-binding domain-containing protein, partial [Verrucomicrobiota bacterium]
MAQPERSNPIRHITVAVDASRNHGRGIIRGVAAYAREVGNWVLHLEIADTHRIVGRPPRGDGMIVSGMKDMKPWLRTLSIPLINVTDQDLSDTVPTVCVNNDRAGQLAAAHLIERGFRQFAGFARANQPMNVRRFAGFARTVEAAGFTCRRVENTYSEQALKDWITRQPSPLGVLAYHDNLARRLVEVAWELGRPIPEDLAIVGMDNDPLFCELAHVAVSSVVQPLHRIGYEAARALDAWLDADGAPQHRPPPEQLLDPVTLIVRGSSDIWITQNPHVAAALETIRRNIDVPYGVDQVADAIGISRRHL